MTSAPQAYRVILDLTISSSVGFDAGHLSKVDRSYALRRQRTQHIVGLAWLGLPAMSLARVCILRAFSSLSIEIERPRFRDRVLLHHLHSPVPSCPLPNNFPSLLKCSAWTSLLGATSNPSRRLAPTLHCNRPWDSEVSCSCGNIPETTLLTNRYFHKPFQSTCVPLKKTKFNSFMSTNF